MAESADHLQTKLQEVWVRGTRILVVLRWALDRVSVWWVVLVEVVFRVCLAANSLGSFQGWFTSFQGLWFSLNNCRGHRLLFNLIRGLPAVYLRLDLLKVAQIVILFHNWEILALLRESVHEMTPRRLGRGEGPLSWSAFLGLLGALSQHQTCLGECGKVSSGTSAGLDAQTQGGLDEIRRFRRGPQRVKLLPLLFFFLFLQWFKVPKVSDLLRWHQVFEDWIILF